MTNDSTMRKEYEDLLKVASGEEKADLVLKNAEYLDVFTNTFRKGDIAIYHGRIAGIFPHKESSRDSKCGSCDSSPEHISRGTPAKSDSYSGKTELDMKGKTVVPGFIDSHIHIESTTVVPSVFAKEALKHGTTAVLTDPHEIANVMGTDGIRYMLEATEKLPLDIFFMLSSCVPSCEMEESGAEILEKDMRQFYPEKRVLGIAEMMNVNGVVSRNKDVLDKTFSATQNGLLIDGHAPLVSGKALAAYKASGVLTDHECTNKDEALEKISSGFQIMIREGTAAKNLESLIDLCREPFASRCMFCTDDRHINDIMEEGHIDNIIRKAIRLGTEPAVAYKIASYNAGLYLGESGKTGEAAVDAAGNAGDDAANAAGTRRGAIAPGYLADLVILDDAESVKINSVYKAGIRMTEEYLKEHCQSPVSQTLTQKAHDTFHLPEVKAEDLAVTGKLPVIKLIDGELLTEQEGFSDKIDLENDVLKAAVAERHKNTGHIGVGFIKGYGLKKGAIATSVAHDSHNIIAIGTNEEDIATAINELKKIGGGMLVYSDKKVQASYSMKVAGLMSELPAEEAKELLSKVHQAAYRNGVREQIDPFMTLSFTSLPVIPNLRITTYGVFDVLKWKIVEV